MSYTTYGEVFTRDLEDRMRSGIPDVTELCLLADAYRRHANREEVFNRWLAEYGAFDCEHCGRDFVPRRPEEDDEILCCVF